MQDAIVREITVKAPKERVYSAVTDPKQITHWFPDAVDGEIKEGEMPVFTFGGHGKAQVYIESVKPHDYFSYRWIPGDSQFLGDVRTKENTLVEFTLEDIEGGTKVTIKESGFSSLPATIAEERFKMNNGGWDFMMGRLEKVFNQN